MMLYLLCRTRHFCLRTYLFTDAAYERPVESGGILYDEDRRVLGFFSYALTDSQSAR